MLRHLQIGNVRDNRYHLQDGINREVCQVQIPGASLVNNPMHGVLNNNPPHGMRKTRLHSKPQGGTRKTRLHNSLLGTRLAQPVLEENNNGTRRLLLLMHGHSLSRDLLHGANKVTNLLHQQRMETVVVQVSRGHNQHRWLINGVNLPNKHNRHNKAPGHRASNKRPLLPLQVVIFPGSNKDLDRHNKALAPVHSKALRVTGQCCAALVDHKALAWYALKKAKSLDVSTRYAKNH